MNLKTIWWQELVLKRRAFRKTCVKPRCLLQKAAIRRKINIEATASIGIKWRLDNLHCLTAATCHPIKILVLLRTQTLLSLLLHRKRYLGMRMKSKEKSKQTKKSSRHTLTKSKRMKIITGMRRNSRDKNKIWWIKLYWTS